MFVLSFVECLHAGDQPEISLFRFSLFLGLRVAFHISKGVVVHEYASALIPGSSNCKKV